ncbi:MAG: prolipoprotein diacylglyceryl transferase [Clostridia bacterium]|nr:prolipoprotein diacylglyceryl transferase [Clostridia bacterium]
MIEVSFPGLGIDNFQLNPVAFEVFGLEVRWYGIFITLGMLAAFAYAYYRSKQEGFDLDNLLDMGLYIIVFGVIGARLYYVLMKLDTYILPGRSAWDNFLDMINIRGGGLGIYGGIIAGALTLYIYCRVKKKDWRSALDMVAPGVMIAQAMGRWGNFFNGEAHGTIVAEGSPLYFIRMGLYPNDLNTPSMAYVHPTFLYESLWNILGFVLINVFLYKRKKFNGQIILTYAAWYGFGRMFIEALRTDSLYLGGGDSGIRASQLVGFLCFVLGTALIIYMLIRCKKLEAKGEYVPVFAAVTAQANEEVAEPASDALATDEINNENNEGDQNNGQAD